MLTASVIEVIRGCGILPISRGVEPAMVLRSAAVLAAEGISVIEVTLDSPDPYDTITALRRQDGRFGRGRGHRPERCDGRACRRRGGAVSCQPWLSAGGARGRRGARPTDDCRRDDAHR